jgi:glycosyltransferase involved in cell wall biosynthesis
MTVIREGNTDSMASYATVVAMPAFNEEHSIAKMIIRSKPYADAVLIVDDGSSDATADIAEALGVQVIRHTSNKGYGGALSSIFKFARQNGVQRLVTIDADGQHNPDDIPRLLAELDNGADIVIGSRFLESSTDGMPAYRKFGLQVLDGATNMSGKMNVGDTQSGFRAYGRRAIENLKISGNGMSVGSEILINLQEYNLKVKEIPIRVRYDIEDTSTHNPVSHGFSVLYDILGIIGYKRPLQFFSATGIIALVLGSIAGIWAYSIYTETSVFPFVMTVVSGLLMILGMLLLVSGLILNSLVYIMNSR